MATVVTLFSDFASGASYLAELQLWRRAEGAALDLRVRAGPDAGLDRAPVGPLITAGGELDLDRTPPVVPTGKAQEAALIARELGELGAERRMRLAIYRALWKDGEDISRIDVLQRLGEEVGLDPTDVRIGLDIDRHRDEVERDRKVAKALGIRRAPVIYVGDGPRARVLVGVPYPADLDAALGVG